MTATGNRHKAEAVFYHQEAADLFHLRVETMASKREDVIDVELGKQYRDEKDRIVCPLSANAEKVSPEEFWKFVCEASNHTTHAGKRWVL